MILQVNFEHPQYISESAIMPDGLEIRFLVETLFVDQINKRTINIKIPIGKDLPP